MAIRRRLPQSRLTKRHRRSERRLVLYVRVVLLAVLFSCPGGWASAQTPQWATELAPESAIAAQPDAASIQAKMQALYAGADSYQDTGSVRSTITGGSGPPGPTTRTFSTAFERKGRFRFEIRGARGTDIVWRDGDQRRSWRAADKRENTPKDLTGAVAEAARMTDLPWTFHVLTLLLPETANVRKLPKLPGLTSLSRIADGTQDGRACYRLQLLDRSMGRAKRIFWIDKSSHQLLRVDERANVDLADGPELEIDKQITYQPVFNRPIPPRALAYDR
jgi:hypothetical protein